MAGFFKTVNNGYYPQPDEGQDPYGGGYYDMPWAEGDPLPEGMFAPQEDYYEAPPIYAPSDYDVGETNPNQPPGPTPPSYDLNFGGFEPSKIDSGHSAKSPKYQFREVADEYGYDQGGDILSKLQELYPDYWGGWNWGGKDVFSYGGDPNDLNPAWEGVNELDFVTNYGNPDTSKSGYWWGVSTPEERAEKAARGGRGGGGGGKMFYPTGGSGGGYGGGGGGSYSSAPAYGGEIMDVLRGLFPGGTFNQNVVDTRLDSVRGGLERERKQRTATNRAMLAERGLLGSGPEMQAQNRAEERMSDLFTEGYSDIYADEAQAADRRMMEALSLATGMTLEQASQAIQREGLALQDKLGMANVGLGHRRADIDESLGLGNLALGNRRAGLDEALGYGGLDLDWNKFNYSRSRDPIQDYKDLLEIWLGGTQVGKGGY